MGFIIVGGSPFNPEKGLLGVELEIIPLSCNGVTTDFKGQNVPNKLVRLQQQQLTSSILTCPICFMDMLIIVIA